MTAEGAAGAPSGTFLLKNNPLTANSRFTASTLGAYGMDQSSSKSLYNSVYPFWFDRSSFNYFGNWDLIWDKTYF